MVVRLCDCAIVRSPGSIDDRWWCSWRGERDEEKRARREGEIWARGSRRAAAPPSAWCVNESFQAVGTGWAGTATGASGDDAIDE